MERTNDLDHLTTKKRPKIDMETENHTLIELIDADATYGSDVVLNHVNMKVFKHDFIGVIGPNGGGKTTLIKLMLGLLKPINGKVVNHMIDGGDYQPIGYLPQINKIDHKFPINVKDVVLSGYMNQKRLIHQFSRKEKENVYQIIEEMGISHLKRKPIGELSGGELQRVFLARAIVSSPSLLILDEPNSFVDNTFEGELYKKLKELNQVMAIVIVSHDVGMISSHVKTIACVNRELHYHQSNVISEAQLKEYNCPIQLITHGDIPHTVLHKHQH